MTGRHPDAPGPRATRGYGPEVPDGEARRRATTDFAPNIVVTAGAGTGKTAILVERTLNLVGAGAADLESLALITFTEKAAAELRLRLGAGLDRLLRRATGCVDPIDPGEDADRSWAWLRGRGEAPGDVRARVLAALAGLDAASVGTLHAFCLDLLRRHPRAAGIDPRAAVGEEASLERLLDVSWDRFLRGPDGPGRRASPWNEAMQSDVGPGAILHLGRALAQSPLPDESFASVPAAGGRIFAGVIAPLLASLRSLQGRALPMAPGMARFLEAAARELAAVLQDERDSFAASVARFLEGTRAVPAAGAKLTEADASEIRETARRAHDLLKILARVDDVAVERAQRVAAPFAQLARAQALAGGLVPFEAMLRLARDLLARDAHARRQAAARFRHILVDEFQDTDPLQYEVLFLLARREPAADDASDDDAPGPATPARVDAWSGEIEAGRLFIVGDPKQSIYRFRGADIAAFRRAVERLRGSGAVLLDLSVSFRSPERLLRPINRLFVGWLGREARAAGDLLWADDHSPPYVPLRSALAPEEAGAPARVSVWSVDPGAEGADAGRRAEALAIAESIRARLEGRADPVRRPRDFALLFRASTHIDVFARALHQAGVPCLVEGARDFAQRPEVIDLVSWLRAAASPNDAPALLAVLRSGLGAVPDRELQRFTAEGHRLAPREAGASLPDAQAFPALHRAFARLEAFRRQAVHLPPEEVIARALVETPMLALHAAAYDGSERVARLRRCADRARALATEGLTLRDLLAQLEISFANEEDRGPLADETLDAVRLLTVHKAKGLEYEVVFVPDLGRTESAARPSGGGVARFELDGRIAAAIVLDDRRVSSARALYEIEQERHEEAEERRVFYVACTRAREELVVVHSRRDRKAAPWRDRLAVFDCAPGPDGTLAPEGRRLDGEVEHRIVRPARAPGAEPAPVDPIALVDAARRHDAAAAAFAAACRSPLASPSGSIEAAHAAEPRDTASETARRRPRRGTSDPRLVARLAGSAVHAALAAIPRPGDTDAVLRAATGIARFALAQESPPVGRDRLAARVDGEIRDIVLGFARSTLPARLSSAAILLREAPILHRDEGGQAWSGTCDVVFRDAGGVVVADYKTEVPDGDPARAALPYHAQIGLYVAALARVLPGEKVRGEVLFIRTGVVVEVPAAGPEPPASGQPVPGRPVEEPRGSSRGGAAPPPSRSARARPRPV
ncbi:MAG TPA: UvrD-helicase domain-containing protein [Candidatus Polarisedimenticolia bacterium]|nr:UvrD-helicase domain-containing protein [Candidatus Polarisedimenticolia bacterium]